MPYLKVYNEGERVTAMNNKYTFAFLIVIILAVLSYVLFLAQGSVIAIFDPQGVIAFKERGLIMSAALLMSLVVIPVFVLTFAVAWRYRAGNTKARYTPNWEHNATEEAIWWAVPAVIIAILAVITWTSSYELDPFKPITSDVPPLTIQVVALDWKWLFIYPTLGIATVNFIEFPEKTPITFEVTADAPMNSFWIPQLGGQIYAMTGMVTQLHLMADTVGTYSGSSANFSGSGFSRMQFTVQSASTQDFDAWVESVRRSPQTLSQGEYNRLAQPGETTPVVHYSSIAADIFSTIVGKYMPSLPALMENMHQ